MDLVRKRTQKKRKVSLILIIISSIFIVLGSVGVVLGTYLAVGYQTILLWISFAGLLPLSVVFAIIAFVFDLSYRKETNQQ
ncbi:MAG: hypothetical protein ACTSSH_04640 [Candidatus Heimdallarchaeota archaeon]